MIRRSAGGAGRWAAVLVGVGSACALLGADRPTSPRHAAAPPTGRTGGFGEQTCVECHLEYDLNAPGGRLVLLGLPERYEPDVAYTLTVRLESEEMVRAGFQAAVRFESGPSAGRPAGELRAIDMRTAVTADSITGIPYGHHTLEGAPVTDPSVASWSIGWRAPRAGGNVVVHVAANSANGDDSPLGDLVYTAAARARGSAGR